MIAKKNEFITNVTMKILSKRDKTYHNIKQIRVKYKLLSAVYSGQ